MRRANERSEKGKKDSHFISFHRYFAFLLTPNQPNQVFLFSHLFFPPSLFFFFFWRFPFVSFSSLDLHILGFWTTDNWRKISPSSLFACKNFTNSFVDACSRTRVFVAFPNQSSFLGFPLSFSSNISLSHTFFGCNCRLVGAQLISRSGMRSLDQSMWDTSFMLHIRLGNHLLVCLSVRLIYS